MEDKEYKHFLVYYCIDKAEYLQPHSFVSISDHSIARDINKIKKVASPYLPDIFEISYGYHSKADDADRRERSPNGLFKKIHDGKCWCRCGTVFGRKLS